MSRTADDIDHATHQRLEMFNLALYEMRLTHLGPSSSDDAQVARAWAVSCFTEAMCVMELRLGKDGALAMVEEMIERDRAYTGPRMKRMKS
jgi:hypothetical protein